MLPVVISLSFTWGLTLTELIMAKGSIIIKRFFLSSTFALCILALSSSTLCAYGQAKEVVKIGVIAPLTGGVALRGNDMKNILSLTKEYFNSKSQKYSLELIFEDGMCGAGSSATTATQKLINLDKVNFIITGCSGETIQAANIAQRKGVIVIGAISGSSAVRNLGDYIFRTYPDVEIGAAKIAQHMKNMGYKRVALISEQLETTEGIRVSLQKFLQDSLLISEEFLITDTDYVPMLLRVKAKNPDAIYLNSIGDQRLALLAKQARQIGLTQPLLASDLPDVPQFREMAGKDLVEGFTYFALSKLPEPSGDFAKVKEIYDSMHPEGPSLAALLYSSFDAFMAIASEIEVAGNNPSAVKNHLYTYQTKGALGDISFDKNGDIQGISWAVKVIKDGKPQFVEDQ